MYFWVVYGVSHPPSVGVLTRVNTSLTWRGGCLAAQFGYVVYRRVLSYYMGEEDALGTFETWRVGSALVQNKLTTSD